MNKWTNRRVNVSSLPEHKPNISPSQHSGVLRDVEEAERRREDGTGANRGGGWITLLQLSTNFIKYITTSYDFYFKKVMVPSLRYLIIVEKLHRLYHDNIIYPFRIYPNRFIYLCGWVGWDNMLLFFFFFFSKCTNCLSFFSLLFSFKRFSLTEPNQ